MWPHFLYFTVVPNGVCFPDLNLPRKLWSTCEHYPTIEVLKAVYIKINYVLDVIPETESKLMSSCFIIVR